jgi:hypothetical protein
MMIEASAACNPLTPHQHGISDVLEGFGHLAGKPEIAD